MYAFTATLDCLCSPIKKHDYFEKHTFVVRGCFKVDIPSRLTFPAICMPRSDCGQWFFTDLVQRDIDTEIWLSLCSVQDVSLPRVDKAYLYLKQASGKRHESLGQRGVQDPGRRSKRGAHCMFRPRRRAVAWRCHTGVNSGLTYPHGRSDYAQW